MGRGRGNGMRRSVLGTAWTWESLLIPIITVVALIILAVAMMYINEEEKNAGIESVCETSVRAAAIRGYLTPANVGDLRCSTDYQTIDKATQPEQKKALASALASCWKQYGRGQLRLFPVETGDYCVVCSRLEFSKPQQIDDFSGYLHDTVYPGTSKTYLQYLTNADVVGAKQAVPGSAVDVSKPQAVVYVHSKNVDNSVRNWVGGGAIIGGAVIWVVTGGIATPVLVAGGGAFSAYLFSPYLADQQYNAAVMLMPYDDIRSLRCTSIEGRAGPLEYT